MYVLVSLLLACDFTCSIRPGGKEYRGVTSSSDPGNSYIIREFDKYPIETRIDIFLYAATCRKDPRFEPILALGGEPIIPNVIERIETEPRAWEKNQLMDVLIRINAKCKCVHSDSAIIPRLHRLGEKLMRETSSTDATYERMYLDKVSSLENQLKSK